MDVEVTTVNAFDEVKRLLCKPCTLVHYDVNKPIKVNCDASPKGLGACLVRVMRSMVEQPVPYASRSLQPAEQQYVGSTDNHFCCKTFLPVLIW